jgi:Caspase domain
MKRVAQPFLMGYLLLSLTGCSVVMALNGKKGANLHAIHVGSTEQEVHAQLGYPTESHQTDWGAKTNIYEYELGYAPSVGRALGNFASDLLTYGGYELVWSVQQLMRADKRRLPVYYGPDGLVAAINETAPATPRMAVAESPSERTSPQPRQSEKAQTLVPMSDVDTVPREEPQQRQNAYAVVIGIEQYREKLPKADFAERDAKLMGEYLTKVLGYQAENVEVRLNEKAARSDLEKYLEFWLPNRVEKDASVFFYFAGHGAPNPKTGEAYLFPYDGDPTFLDSTGYPLRRLYEKMANLPAAEVVVVLDTCFSGAGGRSVVAKGIRPVGLSVENPILASGNTVVLAASAGDQVASTYEQGGHGLLTYFFLKGLQGDADQNKDGTIELAEVYSYLKPQVERVARREFNNEQTPQLLGNPEILTKGVRLIERTSPSLKLKAQVR